jgi:hypothetical protein
MWKLSRALMATCFCCCTVKKVPYCKFHGVLISLSAYIDIFICLFFVKWSYLRSAYSWYLRELSLKRYFIFLKILTKICRSQT